MQSDSAALEGPILGINPSSLTAEKSSEISRLLLKALDCIDDDEVSAIGLVKRASILLQPAQKPAEHGRVHVSGGLAAWQVVKLRAFISDRIDSGISLADLAAVAKLSTSYFSVAFKTSFGRSPHAYVMERRIETAKDQILNTDLSLCEIALNCGLADQAHLSRVFKRVTGMTPSAWRRVKAASKVNFGRRRSSVFDQPSAAV